jgi:flagellar hook-associated protein 2
MAGIQASGIGSGLDISGLVAQLVSAERAPLQQRILRQETSVTTKLSALGSLKGALSAFKSALEGLKSVDGFEARKATSGNTDIFTVTAATKAVAGRYDVEVVRLAQAHQLSSAAFETGTQIGYGTLTIAVGEESFDVEIAENAATLADIRDAINAASDNKGVRATLLNTVDGVRLILTSSKTGEAHAIQVSASGGDGGLEQLVYETDGTQNLTQTQAAQNAMIRIATFELESDTNTFENAIDGVTITAKKPSDGETVSLDIAFDAASVQSRVQKFVTEYNNLQQTLKKLGGYNAETKAAGALIGDSLLRSIESEIRRTLTEAVGGATGAYTTLASIGITTDASGALTLDTAKLSAALDADQGAVARLFASENGVAAKLYAQVSARLESTGDIDGRTQQLNKQLKDIEKSKEALELRMEQIHARYLKQFTALDSLLAQMQSTASYLTQQLSSIQKLGQS